MPYEIPGEEEENTNSPASGNAEFQNALNKLPPGEQMKILNQMEKMVDGLNQFQAGVVSNSAVHQADVYFAQRLEQESAKYGNLSPHQKAMIFVESRKRFGLPVD